MDRARTSARARAPERAFTLVELLIAMVVGLLVSMAAFTLSKSASRFFQHEARIASAQLAVTLGMNRLASDLQRAAFMSSANIQTDPWRCGNPVGWPAGLQALAGVQIVTGTQPLQSTQNGFVPDSIVIGGAFNTTEQFPVRTIIASAGGTAVYLQMNSGPMVRTLNATTTSGTQFADIFRVGRFLRIVDLEGRHEYGQIVGLNLQASGYIVNLASTVPIPVKSPTQLCGVSPGFNIGVLANPVARVRYDLRSLAADPNYGALVAPQVIAESGDDGRTELIRVELDQDGNEIPATLELIAEYAVDLRFGITTAAFLPAALNGDYKTNDVVRFPITAAPTASIYTTAGPVTNGPTSTPQRIRSVEVRLSTRSRAPDRTTDTVPSTPGGAAPYPNAFDGRRSRFLLQSVAGMNYVRLRTLYGEVALANQVSATWP